MSEEFSAEHDEYNEDTEFESHLGDSGAEYEDEEISTDEVDRVLESLTNLLEGVESATVHEHLEEAYNQEDWNIVEDLIDVLDTYITLGEDNIIDDWDDEEID